MRDKMRQINLATDEITETPATKQYVFDKKKKSNCSANKPKETFHC